VRESNESRLEALDHGETPIVISGPAVFEFFLERVLATRSASELRTDWALNVARLLRMIERERSSVARVPSR
jgi:hypothetical protein